MKNISSLDRDSLLRNTQSLIAQEKKLELEILDHLKEIDRRMIHFEMGYKSLFEFSVQYLGLSEASAYRRIAAMRLVREIPEVKEKLETGALSLSNVATVQTFFRAEKKNGKKRTVAEKKEVLEKIENLSKKECERTLFSISPETLPREKERIVSAELAELKLLLDHETMGILESLKNAHSTLTTSQLIKRALSEMLARLHDARAPKFAPVKVNSEETTSEPKPVSFAEIRRQVFARAQSRCEFVSRDGKRCESRHDLELDHRTPRALGGGDTLENLRCLCRAHNAFEAVRILGNRAMQPYLPQLCD